MLRDTKVAEPLLQEAKPVYSNFLCNLFVQIVQIKNIYIC